MRVVFFAVLSLAINNVAAQNKNNQIRECIVENGIVKEATFDYNPSTGAKTVVVNGIRQDVELVYPYEGKDYAAKKEVYQ